LPVISVLSRAVCHGTEQMFFSSILRLEITQSNAGIYVSKTI